MNLDWMILANYAEVNGGLLYISGGGWDTLTVQAPAEGAPPGVFAVLQGTLVIRLLFHQTETGRDHQFEVAIIDEDDEIFVMVAGADNKAHKYPVATGLSTPTLIEITTGLKAGDRVIVRGQDGLPEGAAITVQEK